MKKLIILLQIFVIILNVNTINAEEFLIRDEVHTYTDADCGFYWWYDMSTYPQNWHSPVDYWNGTIQVRVEVISQPSTTPFKLSFIMWEACSGPGGELAGTHTLVESSGSPRVGTSVETLSTFYPVYGGIDMQNAGVISKMGVDIRDEYGTSVSCPEYGYPDYPWSVRAQWYPLEVRFTVVAVSAGSSFSGWNNYVAGAPTHGYSTGPSDGNLCQENWGGSSSSSSSGSSSSGCDPEFIDDAPAASSLVIEGENMNFDGYFVQGLQGASNGNVAGLWSPSIQNSTGSVSVNFPHESGVYDVNVTYLDENDGAAAFRFTINGSLIDSWTGEEQPCQNKYTVRTIVSQNIQNGDLIRIEGDQSTGAYAKIDYIDFTKHSGSSSLNIMPLGNSITFDQYISDARPVGDRGGYRQYLYAMLSGTGLDFNFVGSESSGQNLFPDPENAGFPGISSPQLLQLLRTGYNPVSATQETSGYYLDAFLPEVILLEIGTNGFTTSVETLDSILTEIDNYKLRTGLDAKTIVSQIINRSPLHSETSVYNANIASLVSLRADASLVMIDMENAAGLIYEAPPIGDMQDELHPTEQGYEKIAQLVVDEILRIEGSLPAVPDFLTQKEPANLGIGSPYFYNAHAAAVSKPVYSLRNAPSGMTIDSEYGVIEWASPVAGDYTFDILAENSFGVTSQSLSIQVGSVSSVDYGYTTIMPSLVSNANRRAQALVMPENGNIQSISMYHQGGSGQAHYAVYGDNGGLPGTKLGETQAFTINDSEDWQTVSLVSPVNVPAGEPIWLSWVYENSPVIHYGTGGPGRATTSEFFSGGMPDDFGPSTLASYQYSIYMTYTPGIPSVSAPDSPTELIGSNGISFVDLSWQHNRLNTEGYIVERSIDGGTFELLETLSNSALNYTDTDITGPGIYTYQVAAFNSIGSSDYSNTVSVEISSTPPSVLEVGNTDIFNEVVYNSNRRAQQVSIPQDGVLQSITMYHGTAAGSVLYAVYSDNGNAPGDLLGITRTTFTSQSTDWQTIDLLNPVPVTAGQQVWLAWVFENEAQIYYTSGTPGRASSDQTWSAGMPVSFGAFSISNYIYSIYATLLSDGQATESPLPPGNMSAELAGGASVLLGWDDLSNNEIGFILERMPEGGVFSEIASPGINASSFSDNVPVTDMNYAYRIKATNSIGDSPYSDTAEIFVPSPPVVNEVGYNTVFGQVVYNGNRRAQKVIMPETGSIQQISMYHGPGSGSVLFAVYTDNGGFPGTRIAQSGSVASENKLGWQTVNLTSPVLVDAGESIWLAWVYESAPQLYYDNGGEGRANSVSTWLDGMPSDFGVSTVSNYRYSIYASYETTDIEAPPVAPDNLTADYDAFNRLVDLSWEDNSSNETSFVLEKSRNGSPFSALTTLGTNEMVYTDADIDYDSTYQYRVMASNSFGGSAYSNTVTLIATEPSAEPAIIGYNTIFDQQIFSGFRRAQPINIPADGQLISVSMYHGAGSGNLLYGVYSDLSGEPAGLLASTPVTAVSSAMGWQEVSLSEPLDVSAGQQLWLAWSYEYGAEIYYTSGSPGRAHTDEYYTGSLPDEFNAASIGNYIYSIYATFIPDGGTKGASEEIFNDELKRFSIYPNPAVNNTFYLESHIPLEQEEKLTIELADLSGRIFYREERVAYEIDRPIIMQSSYIMKNLILVRVTTQSQTSVYKLLMQE